jgi:carboxymethylenebutenolidase
MPSYWENLRFGEGESGYQDQDMATYVSFPTGTGGPYPAIIVIQEAFGVNHHIQKVCDQFAKEGYVAYAPALFHRSHPNPMLGYGENEAAVRGRYMGALNDEEIVHDINVTIDYIHRNPRTQGQRIGIVGFCVGGRIAYLAATSCPDLSAAVCYYPGRVLIPFGEGNKAPIDLTGNIKIPVMGNFGGKDQNPSPADVQKIDAALTAAKVSHDFKSYPDAGHGFHCDERASFNDAASKDAWQRTVSFFNRHVKAGAAVGARR